MNLRPAQPLVSVIIPVYNRTRFLGQAIRSVLGQTGVPVEVIVVDDGSESDIRAACQPFGDAITFLRKRNGGQASARNLGSRHAKGEFLLFLDDDDFLEPTALADLLDAIRCEPALGWAVGKFAYVDEAGQPLAHRHTGHLVRGDVYGRLVKRNAIGPPCVVLVAADAFRAVGGFNEDRAFELCEDYDLWLTLAREYPAGVTERTVAGYRRYPGQGTTNRIRHYEAWLRVLRKHRLTGRPGTESEFDRTIARIQLEYGDNLYLAGRATEARRQWRGVGRRVRRGALAIRFVKSYLPASVLRRLRSLRTSGQTRPA
ncbi:MAG TPA: glycosyltransferase [Gemmataceae bacterium]|nr:glycosyltransferase [Gemmataceae bacterium]